MYVGLTLVSSSFSRKCAYISFTYSVTAWGLLASRASTSSALRSLLSVFFVPKAAVESAPLRAALVISWKARRDILCTTTV
jgi:hypothetical protein